MLSHTQADVCTYPAASPCCARPAADVAAAAPTGPADAAAARTQPAGDAEMPPPRPAAPPTASRAPAGGPSGTQGKSIRPRLLLLLRVVSLAPYVERCRRRGHSRDRSTAAAPSRRRRPPVKIDGLWDWIDEVDRTARKGFQQTRPTRRCCRCWAARSDRLRTTTSSQPHTHCSLRDD